MIDRQSDKLKTNPHFAFNVWDFDSTKDVIDAAASIHQDVIIQTSVNVYKTLLASHFSHFVHSYAKERGITAWLNIDHCRDLYLCENAVDSDWDMVMIDMSAKTLDENIFITNELAKYAHSAGCLIEAEIGQVMGIEDDVSVRNSLIASRKEIQYFLCHANIDFLAAAFGNAHGEYKVSPELDYDLVNHIVRSYQIPFVVHGGSGMSDDMLRRLIDIGVKKINISTDLKTAYRAGILEAEGKGLMCSDGFQPTAVEKMIQESICRTVKSKLSLL